MSAPLNAPNLQYMPKELEEHPLVELIEEFYGHMLREAFTKPYIYEGRWRTICDSSVYHAVEKNASHSYRLTISSPMPIEDYSEPLDSYKRVRVEFYFSPHENPTPHAHVDLQQSRGWIQHRMYTLRQKMPLDSKLKYRTEQVVETCLSLLD